MIVIKKPISAISSMAAYVIVCILFVFFALIVYAVILHKKKKQGLKVRSTSSL